MNWLANDLQRLGITAYLANHHDNEAVLNEFVVSDGLCLVIHDFAVDDQLLSVSGLAVIGLNEILKSGDLYTFRKSTRYCESHASLEHEQRGRAAFRVLR